ncbi:sacsin N-terminal ATP-binding-like domain-containing protein [Streptomyces gobiensis]|uniref:sacsin N-terminal ATP-binding-like domain-containing protein n=1 Tax=Streptomyces gobiensis TaxID=2875706 RepID=UPI001E2FC00A|nr:molecular chaperone Hsp90 [Streptomyces gobiensis]UGY92071.1 molecular chaperone Hsp90 [Streptomyces gobiensis]
MAVDLFRTADLRRSVLDAWSASPTRFREDANAEEDLALGGYRDRLVIELAQNASDAAARAGVPGRLRLTLKDGTLVAANTGAHLDAAGVESLSTLRASAKRDEAAGARSVGRFGVGFAAVLAVTDEPSIVGRSGSVRWSLSEAREMVAEVPELADELRRREGHVPLLRLPLPAEGSAPEGYDTAVVLPLRDAAAQELAARLLARVDDALLLTLPGLAEVTVETAEGLSTLTRRQEGPYTVIGDRRWRVASESGIADPALFTGRPVEERSRPGWTVTWAVPVDADGAPVSPVRSGTAPVVHAPTPTDEPLGLPALLIASFPLEPTRRHVAPGPLTDFLLERAADTYATLLRDWHPVSTAVIDLVPGPLGKSELDGALRALLLERLPRVPFLPSGAETEDGEPEALRPRDAEIVEGAGAATVAVLAELFPSLLPAGLERRTELRTLGVPRIPLGEVIDRLAGVERDPAWWRRLYDSLAGVDPDRLTGLPVPLAGEGGRTMIGPRHVLLPLPEMTGADRLARLGLKVAHEEAAHPLLEKLGATSATPRSVLTTPQVRAAVAASLDAEEAWEGGFGEETGLDPEELADTVLGLVHDAGLSPGDEPWLGALALPDEEGELAPAGELVFPGSAFEQVIREGELGVCDAELAERWGERPLTAVGVLADFALVRAQDVVLDPDELEPRDSDFAEPDDIGLLDAVDVWCEDVLDGLPETPVPPVATEVIAVRDLDLVDDDRWPQALAMLAQPPLRDALTAPVRVLLPDGTAEVVRPYTAWWLRGHPVLDGRRPAGLRAAGGDPLLDGLYEEADASGFADPQVLRALGVRTSAAALLDEPGGAAELLSRLADPALPVGPAQLHGLYTLLADLDPAGVTLPEELRAVVNGEVRVVDAADTVVADTPDLLPLAGDRALLPVRPGQAARLATLLEVRRLSEMLDARPPADGELREVPDSVRVLLGPDAPTTYIEHDELLIEGVELDWRLAPDGVLHASTLEGVAAGLAWAAAAWPRRFEVAALLEDPSRTSELTVARWFD